MPKKIMKIKIKSNIIKSRDYLYLDAIYRYPSRIFKNKKAYDRHKFKEETRRYF